MSEKIRSWVKKALVTHSLATEDTLAMYGTCLYKNPGEADPITNVSEVQELELKKIYSNALPHLHLYSPHPLQRGI